MSEKLNINIILEKLYSKNRLGIKPGLERSIILDDFMSYPHKSYKTIHIAGTNGKGAVASILASYLIELGLSVGLYTSPHINKFNERIRVNSEMISDEEVINIYKQIEDVSEEIDATFFEITSTIAFQHFKAKDVDYAIIETGMGGRYDSTNIITPVLSIISSISLDHQEYLGDTITKITKEKAGIIKENIPCIYNSSNSQIRHIIESKALIMNTIAYNIRVSPYLDNYVIDNTICVEINGFKIKTPFIGKYQLENMNLVIRAIIYLFYKLDEENLQRSLNNLRKNSGYMSRTEVLRVDPLIIIDVGHNEAAFLSLYNTLNEVYPSTKFNVVFAAMGDKDVSNMLRFIKPITENLVLTKANNIRSMDINKLYSIANNNGFDSISIEDPIEAYNYVLSKEKPILICGSFYLIGDLFDLQKD